MPGLSLGRHQLACCPSLIARYCGQRPREDAVPRHAAAINDHRAASRILGLPRRVARRAGRRQYVADPSVEASAGAGVGEAKGSVLDCPTRTARYIADRDRGARGRRRRHWTRPAAVNLKPTRRARHERSRVTPSPRYRHRGQQRSSGWGARLRDGPSGQTSGSGMVWSGVLWPGADVGGRLVNLAA